MYLYVVTPTHHWAVADRSSVGLPRTVGKRCGPPGSPGCSHSLPPLIVRAASGGWDPLVASTSAEAGLPVAVVTPRPARDSALGRRATTDILDAQVSARFAAVVQPWGQSASGWPPLARPSVTGDRRLSSGRSKSRPIWTGADHPAEPGPA